MSVIREELVATIVAAQGGTITQDFLQELTRHTGAARTAWLTEGAAVDIFFDNPSPPTGGRRVGMRGDSGFQNPSSTLTPTPLPPQEGEGLIRKFIGERPFDILIQSTAHRCKKILIADMESTVIEQEMLDELAGFVGLRSKITEITRRAMNGELDFAAALRERVALLKGQPESILTEAAKRITFMPGAAALVATMKAGGAMCWLVSGGFTCFVKPVAEQLGFDRFFANELIVRNGILTGEIATPILDKDGKKMLLDKACAELGLVLRDTLAVGDGANDIPMLQACHDGGGLGVAYHAKPGVRAAIPNQINHGSLTALLYAQGLRAFIDRP